MSLTAVVPPAVPPVVTDSVVAAYLRLDEAQYPVLETLIAAATAYLDGPDGVLGRALTVQSWDLKLDDFPWGRWTESYDIEAWSGSRYPPIKIPLAPLRSITSITYLDTDGAAQTWASTDYTLDAARGYVYPVFGETYPATRDVLNAVTIRFVAGPDEAVAADKLLVMFLVAHWYEHREPAVVGQSVASLPEHLDRLINARRLWSVA